MINRFKIILVLFLGLTIGFDLIGQENNIIPKNYLYVGLAISDPQSFDNLSNETNESYNVGKYIVQWENYNFKTPELSAGWMFKRKDFFLNSSLAFWMGRKDVSYSRYYSANSLDPKDEKPYDQINSADNYGINEIFSGKVSGYNLDWHLTVGANMGKHFSMFLGYQRNFLLYTSIDGSLYKYGSHNVFWQPTQYFEVAYSGNDIKNEWTQSLSGIDYFSLGFNYSLEWNKRDLFLELQVSRPFWEQPEANFTYFRLKMACSVFNFAKSETPKE